MLTLNNCADDINVSYKTVYKWIVVDQLVPCLRIMSTIRIKPEDWERFKETFIQGASVEHVQRY
ncbi:pyocin activator protein prtN [Caudoviricetes sp.]|nr:pyocin activator protein prtN [Caudoviricetes sp.]